MKLTSNLSAGILHQLREEYNVPSCACSDNRDCIKNAKNGQCTALNPVFNEYVQFSTGSGKYGFEFAIHRKELDELAKEKLWEVNTTEELISICHSHNEQDRNEYALTLWTLARDRGLLFVWKEYREPSSNPLWYWRHYRDGSGSLRSFLDNKTLVSYDKYTCPGAIEYQIEKKWNIFEDGFLEFKKFAEERCMSSY